MESSRTQRTSKNLFYGTITKFILFLGPLMTRIITVRTIGSEYLGLTGLFSSIFTMLQLSELGFGYAITYKLYQPFARGNIEVVNGYLSFYKRINRIIGCVIAAFGILTMPFLHVVVREELPNNINMYVIYIILLFNTVVSYFLFSYKSVLITVSQRQDLESKIGAVVYSITYILQVLILLGFRNYYAYLIVLPGSTVMLNIIRNIVITKTFPEFRVQGSISKKDFQEIKNKLVKLMGHRISGIIIMSADNIVISMFLGVNKVTKYGNYFVIINALINMIAVFDSAIRPSIGNSMATESNEKNYTDFINISFIMTWIVGWMSITWFCLIQDFIQIAYGDNYKFAFSTVILLAFELYIWKSTDIIASYRDGIGAWGRDTLVPYISSAFNIITNVLLVKAIGINGVIISTVLSFIFFTVPFSIKVLMKDVFGKRTINYILLYIKRTAIFIMCGIITYFICGLCSTGNSFMDFIIKGLICLFIPNCIVILIYRKRNEFNFIKQHISIVRKSRE